MGLLKSFCKAAAGSLAALLLSFALPAAAGTVPYLYSSFAGNINFVGTQKTLRTSATSTCDITTNPTSATLSGIPAGATIRAAYLYWAGSGNTPDYDVTFEGSAVSAPAARRYTESALGTYNYFSGVADVTAAVAAKGNGSYTFSGLTVDNGDPWCGSSAVLAGWALAVVYAQASEDFRVINVYEGFQYFYGSQITLVPSNFQVPTSPINGKMAHITWEGDVGNSACSGGFCETLTFNGNTLTDANNPANNQFNSYSSANADANAYGVDFDIYSVSAYLSAGQTSATSIYSSGGDLVLLSSEIISVTNTPVADLEISLTRGGDLVPGQNASYTINVTNNGPLDEAGPVVVTDVLPAGLSFVSGTGTGWSCSALGQTVTCTRVGSLASGASAPALTLTVAVAAGASGTIANTVSVDGAAFDNFSTNNSATDSYYILPTPYAWYKMDETTWGTVADASGNGRNGTVLGSAAPTGYPPASPPGSALAGNPGTCGAGNIPSGTGNGVDTGIDINSVGSAGTIAFWYSSNTAWNDGNDRMLLDASNNLGNGNADKHFYLVKGDGGELRFGLEEDNDSNRRADSVGHSYPANQWHHIAITWDWNTSNRMYLYLDGVAVDNDGFSDNIGNYATLYLGATHANISGTDTDFTTNTANGYLDEVRIYSSALSAAEIGQLMNLTHSCGASVDHYVISHSGTGLTCEAEPVTITAHNNAHSRVDAGGKTIAISTNTGTGTWSAAADSCSQTCYNTSGTAIACAGTFIGTSGNNGQASYLFASGEAGVRLCLKQNSPISQNINVTDGSASEATGTGPAEAAPGADPALVFADTGIRFYADGTADAIGSQIAGVRNDDGTYQPVTQVLTVRALKSGETTPARCVPLLASTTKTLQFAYRCESSPNTCRAAGATDLQVNGTAVAGNNASVTPVPATNVSVTFNASGYGSINLKYFDVGNISVWARANALADSTTGSTYNVVAGNSNTFAVKPYAFTVANIIRNSDGGANPGAGDQTGSAFIAAGDTFSATVTAIALGGATTPSFGRCDSAGGTGCAAASESVSFSNTLVSPSGGAAGTLGGTISANASAFVTGSGAYAFNNLNWSEVGVITLKASNANYLGNGLGSCTTNTDGEKCQGTFGTSGNVGRFYPHHFTAMATLVPRSDIPSTTGTVAAGSVSLSVASAAAAGAMVVGNTLVVLGAGPGGTPLRTTVAAIAGTTVTLADSASTSVTGANVYNQSAARDPFTYMGEPMLLLTTVTALNAGNTTTTNYATSTSYAKLDAASLTAGGKWFAAGSAACPVGTQCFGYGAIDGATQLTSRLAIDTGISGAVSHWAAGVGGFASHLRLDRSTVAPLLDGPYESLRLGIAPVDSDGVAVAVKAINTVAGANVFNISTVAATTSGTIAAGSNSLSVASIAGIAVGHSLVVLGAGPNGGPLQATVTVVSGTTVTLSAAASYPATGSVYNVTTISATTTGSITAGTSSLNVASAAGITVGHTLLVMGAGVGGMPLQAAAGTVAGTTVTLSPLDLNADSTAGNERIQVAETRSRFGRLRLQNASGSERLTLPMPLTAEYYSGGTWVQNGDDSLTTLTLAGSGTCAGAPLSCDWGGLTIGNAKRYVTADATTPTLMDGSAAMANSQIRRGNAGLRLSAPLLTGNLTVTAVATGYLKYDWDNDGAMDDNPSAIATFGVNKSNFIFLREGY